MTDIKMSGHTLPMANGDFQLVSGVEEIKQHIIVGLNTFYTDWLLDYTKGIDYTRGMRQLEFLENDCKSQIRGVEGVTNIINFTLNFNRKTLVVEVTAGIQTIYGRVDIEQTITRG